MSPEIYCEDTGLCDTRSNGFSAVETCSEAIFTLSLRHGKNPCFLKRCFSAAVGVDYAASVFASVDVVEFLECAF